MFKRTNLLASAALTALMSASVAVAQEAAEDDEPQADDVIVVTGSNIAGASDSGAIAVTTIGRDQLDSLGEVSTGDLLANLPQAGTFEINDSADGPNSARGDVATVNLRGLGTGNTLVLLNGRRITAHGIFQDVGTVPRSITNVNAFPAASIDRVEVLRDGASALYGSDATAGVVNTILNADYDDRRITFRSSGIEGTGQRENKLDLAGGFTFNDGATNLLLTASYFVREGLYSNELDGQFNTVDKRAFLEAAGSPYADANNDFRNTSTRSPFGQFRVGQLVNGVFDPIDVGSLTASDGDFHVQPCSFPGTRVDLGEVAPGVGCVGFDDGNLNSTLRFDFNSFQPNDSFGNGINIPLDGRNALGRQLISDAVRYNAYGLLEHDFDNGVTGFAEALFYQSETESQRAAQPIDDGLAFVIVPAQNYWNPVGPVGSPNRVAGINAPDAGLDVLISRWRPIELGPRIYSADSRMFRLLGGFRGEWNAWDWETAVGYSQNRTVDTARNRMSKQLLFEQLSLDTPDAINPFGGPFANSQAQLDRIRIQVENVGETALTTADFRMSNADFASPSWLAGPVGAAFGVDFRREYYSEDRDPRLDGTTQFTSGSGDVSDISDVVGVSPTRDSDASRNVIATYGEVLVPLFASNDPTFINELNLQVAVRGEYFDDIEDGAFKPKIALSWFPIEALNFRAAYSQGFRAPNLIQLNRGDISRLNQGDEDFYRADVTGDPDDTGETYRASVRRSNPDLENEDTETVVIGAQLDLTDTFAEVSWVENFVISVDYWQFEQENLIGTLGPEVQLALDFQARLEGSSNPNVVRGQVTAADQAAFDAYNLANPNDQRTAAGVVLFVNDDYINLDSQTAAGFDIGIQSGFDFGSLGTLDVAFDASRLDELELVRTPLITQLIDDPVIGNNFSALDPDRIELNGNPEWRYSARMTWRKDAFGAGLSARYVGGYFDTSADPDLDGDGQDDFFPVDSYLRWNGYVDYRIPTEFVDQLRVRLGINNLTDERPPILDDSRGYDTGLHSVRGREFYVQIRSTL
jgi:outer membrane receptor protein involved in Fe transport